MVSTCMKVTPSKLKWLQGTLHFPAFLVLLLSLSSFSPSFITWMVDGASLVALERFLLLFLSRLVLLQGGFLFPLTSILLLSFTITAPSPKKFLLLTISFLFFVHFFFYYFLLRMIPGSFETLSLDISLGLLHVSITIACFGVIPSLMATHVRARLLKRRIPRNSALFQPRVCENCGVTYQSSAKYCVRCSQATREDNESRSRT